MRYFQELQVIQMSYLNFSIKIHVLRFFSKPQIIVIWQFTFLCVLLYSAILDFAHIPQVFLTDIAQS